MKFSPILKMNIKNTIVILLVVVFSAQLHAQNTTAPNRNYYKICILNERDEVLLVEHNNTWELIGGEYNTPNTLVEYVETLALSANVKVKDIRLRGLFSVFFNQMEKPFVYHYYSARYESGEVRIPEGCTGAKWVGITEAKRIMRYQEMFWMVDYILKSDHLRGGAYRIIKDKDKGTRKVEFIEDYYDLN